MAITSAIMQMRRGNEVDFDPDKMLPGEWAVSTDTRIVRICVAPGIVKEIASTEEVKDAILKGLISIQEAEENALINISEGVDNTLSVSGKAADAKVTGEKLGQLSSEMKCLSDSVNGLNDEHHISLEWENGTLDAHGVETDSNYVMRSKGLFYNNAYKTVSVSEGYGLIVRKYIGGEIVIETYPEWIKTYDFTQDTEGTQYRFLVKKLNNTEFVESPNSILSFNIPSYTKEVEKSVDELYSLTTDYAVWDKGGFSPIGEWTENETRLRTKKFNLEDLVWVKAKDGYEFLVFAFEHGICVGRWVGDGFSTLTDGINGVYEVKRNFSELKKQYPTYSYRLQLRRKDNTSISLEESNNVVFYLDKYVKNDTDTIKNVFLDCVSDYSSTDLESSNFLNATGKLNTIYDVFDSLLEQYPDYISKTVLGTDESGTYEIREYRFRPETVGYYSEKFGNGTVETKNEVELPLFLLEGCIHGNEQLASWILTKFFEKLCNSWDTHNTLTFYRWNVEFRVIPVVNPWGFNNNSRLNVNSLDINRQFPRTDTELKTDCIEALIIRNWLKLYKDRAFTFIDLHTAWEDKDRNIAWLLSVDNQLDNISNSIITKLSRQWKKQYDFIDYDGLMGFVGDSTYVTVVDGQARSYAGRYLGYKRAMTFEIANTVQYNNEEYFGKLTTNMYMDLFVNTLNAFALMLGAYYK